MRPGAYRLKDVVWELTLRCNMACHHCGSNALDPRADELTEEQAIDVAHQLAAMPIQTLCLSGGEALLNPVWPEVVEILTSRGCAVSTITNGITICDDAIFSKILELKERGHNLTVSVSIDGMRDAHNMIRGIDCWDRALEAVRKMRAHGLYAVVQTTANHKNVGEMEKMRELIFHDLQPSGWQMQVLEGYGRAGSAREWLLTLDEFKWLNDFWKDTLREAEKLDKPLNITGTNCMGYYSDDSPFCSDNWTGCQAGMSGIGIDSNGNVRGCLSIKDNGFIEGSLKEMKLADIWNRPGSFRYNREFTPDKLGGVCGDCEFGPQCRGGCTSMAHSIFGNPWEQPYCTFKHELLELDDDHEAIRAPMPEIRPQFDETEWVNLAPDAARLQKSVREAEAARIAGQQKKESKIYATFELRQRAKDRKRLLIHN